MKDINKYERTNTQILKVTIRIYVQFLWFLWHFLPAPLRDKIFPN
jgi:hypothetical protein